MTYPDLRAAILEADPFAKFSDGTLAALVEQVCRSEETSAGLEALVAERLDESQRDRLSAFMVAMLPEDPEEASRLCAEYVKSLERRRHRSEIESGVRDSAARTDEGESVAAAQKVIEMRRKREAG